MKILKCPECGASLSIKDDNREFVFCEYCGTKVDLIDRRTEHTERIIDEAKIASAEVEVEKEKRKTLLVKLIIFVAVMGIVVFLFLLWQDTVDPIADYNTPPRSLTFGAFVLIATMYGFFFTRK